MCMGTSGFPLPPMPTLNPLKNLKQDVKWASKGGTLGALANGGGEARGAEDLRRQSVKSPTYG